jgi:hypothetical protein
LPLLANPQVLSEFVDAFGLLYVISKPYSAITELLHSRARHPTRRANLMK